MHHTQHSKTTFIRKTWKKAARSTAAASLGRPRRLGAQFSILNVVFACAKAQPGAACQHSDCSPLLLDSGKLGFQD